jgi:hypothetical protein
VEVEDSSSEKKKEEEPETLEVENGEEKKIE